MQLAIGFTERGFYDMYDEINDFLSSKKNYFDRLRRDSCFIRHLIFSKDVTDIVLNERYSDKKMKSLLAPHKLDNILPGVWVWENKKMIKIDVREIWNNLEVYVNTETITTYSTN